MKVISDPAERAWSDDRSVVTIGAYDGLHLGHQAVIGQVKRLAAERNAKSVLVTFDKHPATVVRPQSAPLLLTGPDQKLELLHQTGLDAVVMITFDEQRAAESPEDFVQSVLVDCLAASAIVVGADFHFGRGREGNVALLEKLGAEHDFDVVPVELLERSDGIGEPISSTAIRRALAGGDIQRATSMLGRPFEARGQVVQGDQRGRLLGFPTANVEVWNQMCLPADGVYAGRFDHPDGTTHDCAINLGRRPTFYEHADSSLLEAHLLDFDGDLYGEPARVRFTHFLRSERKFDGIDALVAQLRDDVEQARSLLIDFNAS
ncbi:MAG: bifunctional riboflavin kinase/FAD synthetase [Actinomycetota bacterium]